MPRDDAATCLEFQASSLYFNPDGNDIHSKARPGSEKPHELQEICRTECQYLNTLGILSTLHFSRYFKLGSKMDELDVEPKAHSRRERR